MSSRRALKAAQAIREVVSTAILLELKDPRVADVTVTLVEVSGDLRAAKVYVSVLGDDAKQNLCLNGLRSSTGYLQKRVGNRIDTRYIPRLTFVLDKGAMNAMEVTRILNEVLPEKVDPPADETAVAENVGESVEQSEVNHSEEQPNSGQPATKLAEQQSTDDDADQSTAQSPWPSRPPGLQGAETTNANARDAGATDNE